MGIFLAAVIALLVLDCLQTLDIKNHPGVYEKNVILGRHPSDAKIMVYFSAWIAIAILSMVFLSQELMLLLFSIIFVVQIKVIYDNKRLGLRFTPWKK